jgi:salicylate hydroxylase
MGPNASRSVLKWGVDLSESPPLTVYSEYDKQGEKRFSTDVDTVKTFGAPWLLNHRVTLQEQLKKNALSTDLAGAVPLLHAGRKVIKVDPAESTVTLDNEEIVKAHVIIGADGIRSVVQKAVIGSTLVARPSGHSAYRCLIPAEPIMKDEELKFLMDKPGLVIFVAEDQRIVAYSCKYQGQDYINIVACVADKNLAAGVFAKESWSEKGTVDELIEAFATFGPKVKRLLSYANECALWQLRDQEPLKNWSEKSVVIIGDAAHPMLPHLGQGGSQAIEDADMLGYLFQDVKDTATSDEIEAILKRFFELRKTRATFCQETSRFQAMGPRQRSQGKDEEPPIDVPLLNPMKTSAFLFSYMGPEYWIEKVKEHGTKGIIQAMNEPQAAEVPAKV